MLMTAHQVPFFVDLRLIFVIVVQLQGFIVSFLGLTAVLHISRFASALCCVLSGCHISNQHWFIIYVGQNMVIIFIQFTENWLIR